MIVTIDGPAGAGKSSAARQLAARLGFRFLDTGAMYRAVTWYCLDRQINLQDEPAVADAARRMHLALDADRVFVDEVEVSHAIRSAAVTHDSRFVAGNYAVRKHLVDLQRRLAAGKDVVTEGRDQGTVAFPQAECKFFLIADPTQRALRRQSDYAARGEQVALEEILAHQTSRDQRDELREYGALKPAPDAVTVDTSDHDLAGVVSRLEQIVRERMRCAGERGA
ncbi:MAG: (d)CMP kinase [Planctomycetaceae bacterium]|nr:(d)CMP kinase [Planctomycetaceae bacterium]